MNLFIKLLFVGLIITGFACQTKEVAETTKPNIIYILADDLGYADLGCYGQTKIETPNIDQLAKEGMMFTQHYSGSAVCAPSRSVLLTGKHSGIPIFEIMEPGVRVAMCKTFLPW